MQIVLATHNAQKTREFAELLGRKFVVVDLTAMRGLPEIVETGQTFAENAAIKAIAVSRQQPQQIVIADDSGLEVEALGGAPGIFSARFAGEHADDQANVAKLLRKLRGVPQPNRSARFRCAIAIARTGKLVDTVAGEIGGVVIDAPRGKNGFGYDPVFIPEGFAQTFAELPPEVKNRVSHRARAVQQLRRFLLEQIV